MKAKWDDIKCEFVIITVFLIMSLLMCPHYTINFDEFYTMEWCRSTWSVFLYEVLHDTSPFLYYFLIRPYVILTGQNIFLARLFSIAFLGVILMIGATFVKRNFGRKSMVFYLMVMYLNPFMMQKSTEIRMYVLATAFTLLSGVFCYKLLKFFGEEKIQRKNWILFTLFSLLGSYTHYYVVLTMVFLYLGLLGYYMMQRNLKELKNWLLCCIVTVVGYLPVLLIAIAQIKESSGGWIPEVNSRLEPIKQLFYSRIAGTEYIHLAIIAGFTLLGFVAFLRRRTVENYWALVCCSALWGILVFGIVFGKLVQPILMSRYLIMPLCLLFLGISSMVRYVNKYFVLLLCLFFCIVSGLQYKGHMESLKEDRTVDMIRFADENIREGDKIILIGGNDYLYNCTQYYIPQAERYYVHDMDAVLELLKENAGNQYWFFDDKKFFQNKVDEIVTENFGTYQFSFVHMEIYKIQIY